MTPPEREKYKAKQKSEWLLRQWLTNDEWKEFRTVGEIKVQDILNPATCYIIKKDPNAFVDVIVDGEKKFEWCVVALGHGLGLPIGDQLLTKVLGFKLDQEHIKKIKVVQHRY